MANKRLSVDIPEGKLSAGYGGGGFSSRGRGRGAFDPPKSFSGDAAPVLNRAGKTTAKVDRLQNAERKPMYEADRPFRVEGDTPRRFQHGNQSSEGLGREELRRIGEHNISEMRAKQAREAEPLAPKPLDAAEIARRKARMEKFGVDPKRFGYRKGGAVRDTRNYGK